MKPRRCPDSTSVFQLVGGNEDNDLWVKQGSTNGEPWIESVWELDEDERQAIAAGATIELRVFGVGTPPVSLTVGPSLANRKNDNRRRTP